MPFATSIAKDLTHEEFSQWLDAAPTRQGHYDIDLLRHISARARRIRLWPAGATTPCYPSGCVELTMQMDTYIYWNEWDSFSGWVHICDILWTEQQALGYSRIRLPRNVH